MHVSPSEKVLNPLSHFSYADTSFVNLKGELPFGGVVERKPLRTLSHVDPAKRGESCPPRKNDQICQATSVCLHLFLPLSPTPERVPIKYLHTDTLNSTGFAFPLMEDLERIKGTVVFCSGRRKANPIAWQSAASAQFQS